MKKKKPRPITAFAVPVGLPDRDLVCVLLYEITTLRAELRHLKGLVVGTDADTPEAILMAEDRCFDELADTLHKFATRKQSAEGN